MICIYHRTDFDGKCSGAIVKRKYPYCKLYPIDYADIFDINRIDKNDEVIMVDFTLEKPGQMEALIDRCRRLTWIDHHETAMETQKRLKLEESPGIRFVGIGACELTWTYLFSHPLPYSVYLLSKYDVWDQSNIRLWEDQILPFQYGMRLNHSEPDNQQFWRPHFRTDENSSIVRDIILAGKSALKYDENLSERIAKSLWFPIEFEGLKFQAINRSHANFLSAKSIWNPEEFDAIMYFCKGPNLWRITVFTDKEGIDLFPLAKKLGGGGHKQAAGFTTNDILKTIPQLLKF
jgi:oligoribonuclease NrnB/cAMP/cGMP phosphodiesterase (DHH superfamily)